MVNCNVVLSGYEIHTMKYESNIIKITWLLIRSIKNNAWDISTYFAYH